MILRRRIMVLGGGDSGGYVDLGLPSGLLWAVGNLVKDSQGNYSIGAETDYGTYVSWGNIDGHNEGEGYSFSSTNYDTTLGKALTADIPSNDAVHDIALARLGYPWNLPTKEDFQELYDNTDSEWTTINGVNGWKFMKKTDHSVFVFFPAAGRYNGTTRSYRNSGGYYWSSSYYDSSNAYRLYFYSSNVNPQANNNRYRGHTVRPVCKPMFSITITLTGDEVSGITVTVTDSDGISHSGVTDSNGVVQLSGVIGGSAKVSASGYTLTPSTINVNSSSRTFTIGCEYVWVDLGLPSGLLWAKGNICKDSYGNYYIGEGTENGCYFSWANIVGHNIGEGYNFNQTTYNGTPGASHPNSDISPTDAEHDAAYAHFGSPWRLPTRGEITELSNNTDKEKVTIDGTSYLKLMNKSDHTKYILFPFMGRYNGTTLENQGTYGRYFIASNYNSDKPSGFYVEGTSITASGYSKYFGLGLRAVRSSI